MRCISILFVSCAFCLFNGGAVAQDRLQRVQYNNPGLVVDLGVGLSPWPVPMDGDGDGDYDLYVSIDGRPSNGTYIFENTTGHTSKDRFPVFQDGRKISRGYYSITPSYVDDRVIVASRNLIFPDFAKTGLEKPAASGKLNPNVHMRKIRANQWRYVDYDGDGIPELLVGAEDGRLYHMTNQDRVKNGEINAK